MLAPATKLFLFSLTYSLLLSGITTPPALPPAAANPDPSPDPSLLNKGGGGAAVSQFSAGLRDVEGLVFGSPLEEDDCEIVRARGEVGWCACEEEEGDVGRCEREWELEECCDEEEGAVRGRPLDDDELYVDTIPGRRGQGDEETECKSQYTHYILCPLNRDKDEELKPRNSNE